MMIDSLQPYVMRPVGTRAGEPGCPIINAVHKGPEPAELRILLVVCLILFFLLRSCSMFF